MKTENVIGPYEDSLQHFREELDYLDLLIGIEVSRFRRGIADDRREWAKGLYISDEEVDSLLEKVHGRDEKETQIPSTEYLASLRKRISDRKISSFDQGIYLSFPALSRIFGLQPVEELIVLTCLAPELDGKYARIFAYLQDDISRKRPSVDLLLRLLSVGTGDRIGLMRYFTNSSPLFHYRLLKSDGEPLSSRSVRVDESIAGFLLGYDGRDKDIAACTYFLRHGRGLEELRWPEAMKSELLEMITCYLQGPGNGSRKLVFNFCGPSGTGRKTLASALCRETGIPIVVLDLEELIQRTDSFEEAVIRVFREAVLRSAALFIEKFDLVSGDEEKHSLHRRVFARCMGEFSWITFISTGKKWTPADLFGSSMCIDVDLPAPDINERALLWRDFSAGYGPVAPGTDWSELASKFRLTPGRMNSALRAASDYARMRGAGEPLSAGDLVRACKAQSNQKLGSLARRLRIVYTWDDLILPPPVAAHLREICGQVRHRRKVYGEWGFEHKLAYGKGLCVLLYGQSGTGKTMAVQVMAKDLGLDAFKIDLSTVVSKYIGETEKNLGRIFDEAETSNAILFFDEADALFGKRSEVKDAHDRYANIEINYLLQRIEDYEGLVILATNLRKNMDEAFFRRMNFAVEFPFPDGSDRYRIWKRHFPESVPVSEEVDFNFLAGRFNVPGGNIRNIVLNAAFMAAGNSGVVDMEHLVRATIREYEKMGRMCTGAEIAPYQHFFKEDPGGGDG